MEIIAVVIFLFLLSSVRLGNGRDRFTDDEKHGVSDHNYND